MERKEMTEKVANMICGNETQCNSCLKCTIYDGKICCKHLRVAENLVDTIIPEGAVVLTAEERDEEMREYNRDRAEIEERVRKEMVKKIIDFLNEQGNFGYDYPDEPHSPIVTFDPCIFEDIEREFGAEVEG